MKEKKNVISNDSNIDRHWYDIFKEEENEIILKKNKK